MPGVRRKAAVLGAVMLLCASCSKPSEHTHTGASEPQKTSADAVSSAKAEAPSPNPAEKSSAPETGEGDPPNPGSPAADALSLRDAACGAFAMAADDSVFHMVAEREYTWEPGTTINVWFMDGKKQNMATVERVAKEWSRYANIDFTFFPPDETPPNGPQLRVSFQQSGYWSLIGSQAAFRTRDLPTMNLNFRLFSNGDDEISRVVLHEFGHALGLWHEHQNPNATFTWDRDYIYNYYARTQGWDRATVDTNIFEHLDPARAAGSDFDASSIMLYSFPKEFTQERIETPYNHQLSDIDKREIALLYPGRVKPTQPEADKEPEPLSKDKLTALSGQLRFQFTTSPAQNNLQNYAFRLSGPDDVLAQVDHVLYQRQHDTFREFAAGTHYRVGRAAAASGFEFAWQGWGWVPVEARVVWKDGQRTTHLYKDAPTEADAGPDWDDIQSRTRFYFAQTPPNAEGWADYAVILTDESVAEHIHWVEYQRQHDTFPEFAEDRFLKRDAQAELFALEWRGYGWVPVTARVHYKNGDTRDFQIEDAPEVIAP